MIQKPSILLVDDEMKITQVLAAYLQKGGYETEIAHDGRTALELFANKEFSLVVLDLMLPDICGEEICRNIRSKSRIPIIMLTAKSDELNLIQGLKLGADDYIIKPFSPRTVVAKIEAVLRRAKGDELVSVPITFGNGYLSIDFKNNLVKKEGDIVGLTPTEYKILKTMAKAPGRIFTRDQLIAFGLDDNFDGYDRSIDTYIKSIRSKIEPDRKSPIFILTVHGMGYKFASEYPSK
ncbi:MAG: response regulator transcription factor [Oscillospiraceae bacterium]|uniref:response regulator transcription factor n=1 Tax=Pygmaiobacter massiliensis TaxID=1917873 RepID=UPI0028965590|nr:response regulator transcription factor [Pygmaiobacter massiliensis]MDD3227590.1 response regulator transcription factor [Oscillospiraceae bacterium]